MFFCNPGASTIQNILPVVEPDQQGLDFVNMELHVEISNHDKTNKSAKCNIRQIIIKFCNFIEFFAFLRSTTL